MAPVAGALGAPSPAAPAVLQDVRLYLGTERASALWHIALQVEASAVPRTFTLWDDAHVELVHAQIDTYGVHPAPDAHIRTTKACVILDVEPTQHRRSLSLTLYARVALLPRIPGGPYACQFYSCAPPIHVRTKEPHRMQSAQWVEHDAVPLWSAHFAPMSELHLEWMPVSETSPTELHASAVYHEIWACTQPQRLEHCVHLHVGPLSHGMYEVCQLPSAPDHLAAYVDGHPVPTRIDASSTSPIAGPKVHCMLVATAHAHLVLRYSTPWPRDGVTRPAFSCRLPMLCLRVHSTNGQRARFGPLEKAHTTYVTGAVATWFDVEPYEFVQVPVHWISESSGIWERYATLALSVTAAFLALVALYALHTTSEYFVLRTDMLAMALDIDFSDGAWSPTPPAQLSYVAQLTAWLQAPWAIPV